MLSVPCRGRPSGHPDPRPKYPSCMPALHSKFSPSVGSSTHDLTIVYTAHAACSRARYCYPCLHPRCVQEGSVRARHELLARAHNRHILGMLARGLEDESLEDAVDIIACGVGPGSFTGCGLRSAWPKGLAGHKTCRCMDSARWRRKPIVPRDAGLLDEGDRVLSTIDAQIDQFYGVWGDWRGGAFVADGETFVCAARALGDRAIETRHGGDRIRCDVSGTECRARRLRCAVAPDVTPRRRHHG